MARTIKPRKSRISVVVIADGEDEKWYYMRLGGEEKLICARRNATPFQLHQCQNTGGSEMNLLFDFFDEVAESI